VVLKSNIDDCLENALHFCGNVLVAGLSWSQAESTALAGAFWAASPANWANAIGFIRAVWVAKRSALNKFWWANKWFAIGNVSVIRTLGA